MNKLFIILFALLIIVGFLTMPVNDDPEYIIGIVIGENTTTLYYVFYPEGDSRPNISFSIFDRRFSSADIENCDTEHLKCIYFTHDAKLEDIGAFLSISHDSLPLSCPAVICEAAILKKSNPEGVEAVIDVPDILEDEYNVCVFEYMNGHALPEVIYSDGHFKAEYK